MSKSKEKALNLARQARKRVKKYAKGGTIDINDTFDPTEGGQIPKTLQQMVREPPKTWKPPAQIRPPRGDLPTPDEDLERFMSRPYADGGEVDDRDLPLADPSFRERWYDRAAGVYAMPKNANLQRALERRRYADGGDVDWSRLNQPMGELKGTAPEDTPVAFKTKNPLTDIHEGDIERGVNVGMGAGPGIFVGPYGALMTRTAGFAKPHPVYAKDVQAAARKLPPEHREDFIRDQVEYRDDLAKRALEQLPADKPDDAIWRASGWSRGPGGEPTKEIPDLGARLKPIPGTDKYELVHPAGDLHKLYDFPPIRHDPSLKGRGLNAIVMPDNTISVSNPNRVSDALHEVQHIIDRKEGGSRPPTLGERTRRPEMEQELYPIGNQKYALPEWQYQNQKKLYDKKGKEAPSKDFFDIHGLPGRVARDLASDEVYLRSAGEVKPRNVQNRFERGFNYQLHPELTEDYSRGVQWVDKSLMPRPREEVLSQIKNSYIRKSRRPWENVLDDAMDPRNDPKKAGGGGVGNFNPERASAYGLAKQGMIKSTVPGRTDKINMSVPVGSYIIPADIPSAIGEGNSDAGGAILGKMFTQRPYGLPNKGPYGMNLPRKKGGMRVGKRKTSLSMSFAEGGQADDATPIVAAGGEYVLHPDTVLDLGGGDMDLGHAILDDFVKQIRSKHIKTLKGLKPPKGSE